MIAKFRKTSNNYIHLHSRQESFELRQKDSPFINRYHVPISNILNQSLKWNDGYEMVFVGIVREDVSRMQQGGQEACGM